jgi:hypothetical protein
MTLTRDPGYKTGGEMASPHERNDDPADLD